MKTVANERIGTSEYDGLIYDLNPPANVFAITITGGESTKIMKRGTVLALDTVQNKFVELGAENAKANCILAEDVEVNGDTTALAYRTGHFAENKLIGNITTADKEDLRVVGILLSDAVEY